MQSTPLPWNLEVFPAPKKQIRVHHTRLKNSDAQCIDTYIGLVRGMVTPHSSGHFLIIPAKTQMDQADSCLPMHRAFSQHDH